MKNEFILAFNEICESRNLPKEEVFDALKTALVSAYRRNTNVSNSQEVTADIDPRTGEPTILAEKEVVDSIIDSRTEVLLDVVVKAGYKDAELGDTLMVESTPADFGRIAAQTAKQVLLQRVREAEREQLYEDFLAREDEIVNGTVQSISGQHITIGLGRTEAILTKGQQVQGERYRAHDKIRTYVLEVRRTSRGPQIFVSRNHRNLLRRLLELEVPEIYNGQVDIKSIAREAGARSKVAVMAMQPGVDPVGACVGMRGVRIQSIVRELNDEKIDVIEWDPDQRTFIAKALSPARVSQVFLEEHPEDGKTAVVIVPDDQLSLAIGREGQNARLGAKLTGWRIDIKSLTEAANESLGHLDHPAADSKVVKDTVLIEKVKQVIAKKEQSRPITAEDYNVLNQLVSGVEGRIISERSAAYEALRERQTNANEQVPEGAQAIPLTQLGLSERVAELLLENNLKMVGEVIYQVAFDTKVMLDWTGFGEKALEEVKEAIKNFKVPTEDEEEAETESITVDADLGDLDLSDLIAATLADDDLSDLGLDALGAGDDEEDEDEAEAEAEGDVVEAEADQPMPEADVEAEPETTAVVEPVPVETPRPPAKPAPAKVAKPAPKAEKPKKKPKKKPKAPAVALARPAPSLKEKEDDSSRKKQKGKQLVFDEDAGRVVVKRKRKRQSGGGRSNWDELLGDEFDLDDLDI